MKDSANSHKSKPTVETKTGIHTPVPPQVQYPLEKPDSKKNQQTKPGNEASKK